MLKRDYEDYERAHEIIRSVDGQFHCLRCRLSWQRQPKTYCAGVPVFRYGAWPASFYTYTQLRRDLKMKPLDREQPDGAYFIRKSPYRRWLYSIDCCVPRRVPTELQREAISKMREGLVRAYTCQQCGYYDPSHGKKKYARRLERGWCSWCWKHHYHLIRQSEQCSWAHDYVGRGEFVVIDSETSGLDFERDEVIELSIVTGSGAILFNSLIQPEDPWRSGLATDIHGIDRKMLQAAPRFPDVWPRIQQVLRRYRRVLVYNAAFDHAMLRNTARRYGYRVPAVEWECLMVQFARYASEWDDYHGGYGWVSLDWACREMGVQHDGPGHRALADTQRALGVLKAMAARHGQIDVLEPPLAEAVVEIDLGELAGHPF